MGRKAVRSCVGMMRWIETATKPLCWPRALLKCDKNCMPSLAASSLAISRNFSYGDFRKIQSFPPRQ